MAWLAADRSEIVELDVDLEEAVAACDDALSALGWVITGREEGRVSAYEDPIGLSCNTTPSSLEIQLNPWSVDRTAVTIELSAPGIGPAPARRAERQVQALAARIQGAGPASQP